MNRLALWLARKVAQALEPDERDAFLGDQAELGKSGPRAAYEALGLVIRRQLQASPGDFLWWFIIPFCPLLVSQSIRIAAIILPMDPVFTSVAVMLCIMSWTSGFFVGAFSGRSIVANSALLFIVWLASLVVSLDGLQSPASVLLLHLGIFFLPAIAGLVCGSRGQSLTTGTAAAIASAPSLIVMWMAAYLAIWGLKSGGESSLWNTLSFLGLLFLVVSYPGALLLFFSRRRLRSSQEAAQ